MRALYIETFIRADLDEVWRRTQDPREHQQWDLRFTTIEYDPETGTSTRRLRYSTRLLPGLTVNGTGIFAGERWRPDGTRTSALRFHGTRPLSLIDRGDGYWRYVPTKGGVRFFTGYDYEPAWGRLGAVADLFFRPLMGWATAWSFDRLRLWLERGITPRQSLLRALGEVALRCLLCIVAAVVAPPVPAAVVVAIAALVPPSPGTPAARRCLREPRCQPRRGAPSPHNTLE